MSGQSQRDCAIKARRVWDVLYLYNQISSDYPGIGRWVMTRTTSDARFKGGEAPVLVPASAIGQPVEDIGDRGLRLTVDRDLV